MNACPLSIRLPDNISKAEFMGCNLNPVVVLTDFMKTLGSSSSSSSNYASEKVQTKSTPTNADSKEDSEKLYNIKSKNMISLNPDRSTSSLSLSNTRLKSVKRKRESWDPSVEYEIEKIVGYHRDKRKKMWYFIKWKNWSSDHNTFEPIENLTGCHYELMKYFETKHPKRRVIKKKSSEVKTVLKDRVIYKRLMEGDWNAEDVAEFSRKCPDAGQLFQMNNSGLQVLKKKIQKEYKYIIRCLIGMFSHQDPVLFLRAQNYKFLIILIEIRQKQLQKMALVEELINSREQTKIVIENEVDLQDFPEINYIGEIKPGEGVEVLKDALLGCECSGGCTPYSSCCGVLKDSAFAYNGNGKLRTSRRIAIYECNDRCRCPPTCPNRVVQRGRLVKLSIFKTKSCGWGVKALEKIPKGTFVCEYVGELIPDSEAIVRDVNYFAEKRSGYIFDLDFFIDPKLDMYCIDATENGNFARFINHSCDPNLVVYPVWIDSIEPNKHRLAFFARRNIQKDEEIQFDYENLEKEVGRNEMSHGLRMMSNVRCQCKASTCREWIFGNK